MEFSDALLNLHGMEFMNSKNLDEFNVDGSIDQLATLWVIFKKKAKLIRFIILRSVFSCVFLNTFLLYVFVDNTTFARALIPFFLSLM